jgi:hypothetical protein
VNAYQEVHIEGMNTHATIHIDIGRREKVLDIIDFQARLFLDFTTHAILYGLIHVAEASRQVKSAFGRLFGTTHYQQLIVVVDDKRCRGRTGVGIIGEATVSALLALEVVDLKMTAATYRTVSEFL